MVKKLKTFILDEETFLKFKKYCNEKGLHVSKKVNSLITEFIEKELEKPLF